MCCSCERLIIVRLRYCGRSVTLLKQQIVDVVVTASDFDRADQDDGRNACSQHNWWLSKQPTKHNIHLIKTSNIYIYMELASGRHTQKSWAVLVGSPPSPPSQQQPARTSVPNVRSHSIIDRVIWRTCNDRHLRLSAALWPFQRGSIYKCANDGCAQPIDLSKKPSN